MTDAIAHTPQQSLAAGARERRLWYPPLELWRLYVLMVVTCNVYAVFWIYRVARDVRDHADSRVSPLAYSVSLLLGIVAVFSGARLTWRVLSLRGGERTKHQNLPPVVSLLVFVAYFVALLGYLGQVPAFFIASLLLFPVPWLLVQRRMNAITRSIPAADYRLPARRVSAPRIGALGAGLALWLGLLSAVQMDVVARGDAAAVASRLVTGGSGGYTVRVPSSGWYHVAAGTIGDPRADMELLGPSIDTWAIVYVHKGVTLNEVVAFRARQLHKYDDVDYTEARAPQAGANAEISYVAYEATDPFGQTWNWVTTAQSEDSVVELIVSARDPDEGNPRALANSLTVSTPLPRPAL